MKSAIFVLICATVAHAALAPVDHNACRVRVPIYAGDTSQVESYIYGDWMTEDDAMNQATALVDDGTQVAVICKPAKPHLDRTEWALLAGDATMRALDAYSTRRALEGPNKENTLPMSIAGNTGAMWAYSMGIVAFDWFLVRELDRKHHRKLAKAVYLADIGIEGSTLRNFSLKPKQAAKWRTGQ